MVSGAPTSSHHSSGFGGLSRKFSTLQLAPSVWTDHLELKLEASVIPESLLQKVLRLYFEPKKTPFLALGEESEELGD